MANVINLGTVGQDPSPLSGLSDAIAEGMRIGETRKANAEVARSNRVQEELARSRQEIDTQNTQIRAQEAQLREQELQATLAKNEFDKTQKNRDNTMKSVEQLSLYLADKTPQEKAMFKTTDQYKELSKLVKKYAPEMYNSETKEITMVPPKDIYTDQLNKIKAQNAQILASGGQLTEGQRQAQDLLDKVEPSILGIVLEASSSDPYWADPSKRQQILSRNLQAITQSRQQLRGQSANPYSSAMTDPLGIMGAK